MKNLLLLGLSLAIAVALVMARRNLTAPKSAVQEEERPSPLTSTSPVALLQKTAPVAEVSQPNLSAWARFKENFGADLQPKFDEGGRLVEIQGKLGQGPRAAPGFNPHEPQQAIARAKEILSGARELLGIQSNDELSQPRAQGTDVSAQVLFKQSMSGNEVAPFGAIEIDLGTQGELIGLNSSFLPGLKSGNQAALDSASARQAAIASGISGKIDGESPVFWVTGPNATSGLYAYRFAAQGKQIVVDAQSGKIIARTDSRQF